MAQQYDTYLLEELVVQQKTTNLWLSRISLHTLLTTALVGGYILGQFIGNAAVLWLS